MGPRHRIQSAEQARDLVQAVTYPPHGVRGVGSALARASEFAGIADYLTTARDETCLLVQVENRAGMAALDDILQVDGIDGVFIGPSDLAADMGHIGKANEPAVEAAVLDGMRRIASPPQTQNPDATVRPRGGTACDSGYSRATGRCHARSCLTRNV